MLFEGVNRDLYRSQVLDTCREDNHCGPTRPICSVGSTSTRLIDLESMSNPPFLQFLTSDGLPQTRVATTRWGSERAASLLRLPPTFSLDSTHQLSQLLDRLISLLDCWVSISLGVYHSPDCDDYMADARTIPLAWWAG